MEVLERARKKLELSKVRIAREEMEFKILERTEEIKRFKDNIEHQKKREAELEAELASE